jgi:HlyD family secretion protein
MENLVEFTSSEGLVMPNNKQSISVQSGFIRTLVFKVVIFVVLATVIAVGAYFGAQAFLLNDDQDTDGRRPVTVGRGTLLDDVTASGSVSFPELESLRFEISGTVAELLVDEGESVVEGQLLIRLDNATIADLESAVANAEIALKEASEDLSDLLGGATNLESAIAESNLADARVASMNAADALAEFTSTSDTESPATIAAKDELIDTNEALSDALLAAKDDAKAQDELVSDALLAAENDAKAQDELVSVAQETYGEAATEYSNQISGWFGSVVSEDDRTTEPSNLFDTWGTTVDEIFETGTSTLKSPPDDLSTPWNESIVWVWTHLTPYPILTNCGYTSFTSPFTARCPSAEIDDAWDEKIDAEETLVEVLDDAALAAKAQQVLIDTAKDNVESADKAHQVLIDTAKDNVESAASDVVDTVNDIDINALRATLVEKNELEKDAEKTLGTVNDLDLLQIKLATASVNQTNALLQNANYELEAVNLTAPFAGIISSISVDVGDAVSRQTPTIDILDPTVVTVDGTIDEIDVLSLRLGDEVAVTLDALPDQVLRGVIDEIGDGVNQQGVIKFPLSIILTAPNGIELIEGLSATATIVLNQINNALLVPLQAIGGTFDQPTVDVGSSDGFITTEVQLGASDDFWVVVESGLSEGQEVLMEIAEPVDPLQQLFGGGRGPMGITGGGGGIRGRQ